MLQNTAPVPVSFTVNAEAKADFSVQPRFGSIKANSSCNIVVGFTPKSECNFWKRLSVLLSGTDPLDVDLIGTGYSDHVRPPPLPLSAVHGFLARVAQCGSIVPPAQLEDGNLPSTPLAMPPGATHVGENGRQGWDLLFAGQDVAHALQVDAPLLDFGECSAGGRGTTRTLTVTNQLPFKVNCGFSVPVWTDAAEQHKSAPVWHVRPALQDIAGSSQGSFEVTLQAPADQRVYTQQVDVVAHAKHMRTFRLCNEVRHKHHS